MILIKMDRYFFILISILIVFSVSSWMRISQNSKAEELIEKNILKSQNFEEFKQILENNEFTKEDLLISYLGPQTKLAKYKNGDSYYVTLEFLNEGYNTAGLIKIDLDTMETTKPQIIYSKDLRYLSECHSEYTSSFEFRGSEEMNEQWIAFYVEANKKDSETVHGEILLTIDDMHWSSSY